LKDKLLNGVSDSDKIIAVRFVEWVIALTNVSKYFHDQLREILDLIFEHFFNEETLIKVTLIDLIVDICEAKWNAEYMIENGFITRMLNEAVESGDVYGLINHRLIVNIACIYSRFPDEFAITDEYFYFLKANMESTQSSDRDWVLNALFFLLVNKKSLDVLVTDTEFIINWLRTANYMSEDLRKSFFLSMKSLLHIPKDSDLTEEYNELIYKIFSNVGSPANYNEGNGSIKDSVAHFVKYVILPVETTEAKVSHFNLLEELIQWHWGFKELFKNGNFCKYLLNRKQSELKPLLEVKYEFVKKVISSPFYDAKMECIDSTIAEQLKNYYKNGIYGVEIEEIDNVHTFQVATEGSG